MDKKEKSQVLIISLWILVILTILAISIGHRVSMALRLSRYQRDRLKAYCLAKAGINRAILELEEDRNNYDSLNEPWADNEEIFAKISFGDNQDEFATVSYVTKEDDREEVKFGVIDEERKINLSEVPQDLLEALLTRLKITNSSEIANNIRAWRGDTDAVIPEYADLGYSNKGKKFTNVEELALVKGIEEIDQDTFRGLKDLITVWGDGKVNINTVSEEILKILIDTSYNKLLKRDVEVENPEGLLESILTYRESGVFFTDINLESKLSGLSAPQKNIITDPTDGLKNKICVRSDNFLIEVSGNTSKIKSRLSAIFNRKNKKVSSWHES